MGPHSSNMLLLLAVCCHFLVMASAQIADNMLPFIGAPQGISFKADNNNYLARFYDGESQLVLADRADKDPFTKFHVHNISNDLLAFECDYEGSGLFWQVLTHLYFFILS